MPPMNTKSIGIFIAVVVVVLAGGIAYMQTKESGTSTPAMENGDTMASSTPSVDTTGSGDTATPTSYTAAEVALHKDGESCWTIIDGNVYDLTQWIPQHPGGAQAILGLCGRDGTEAFHGQHDDAKRQADILATFKIGTLSQ